ncbi:MAG: hypothetical protein Q8L87_19905 [Anaerolineales bacterium]|jgi:hypothetical protein|nr:hypothetical protein [Anaerolineales bacterium]
MTHHKTHALKPFWFHHKPHTAKRFDWAIPAIIVGVCADLTLIYVWSFYIYQSVLLP